MDPMESLISVLAEPLCKGLSVLKWQDLVTPLRASDSKSIVVAEGIEPSHLVSEVRKFGLQHVCQVGNPFSVQEMLTSALMLSRPIDVMENPFAAILAPGDFEQSRERNFVDFQREFDSLNQKPIWLDELKIFMEQKVRAESLRTEVLTIVDELYTNVIFNAPFVTSDNPMPQVHRGEAKVLPQMPKKAKIKISLRDDSILVACEDAFGSLLIDKLMQKISGCYEKGVEQTMNMGNAGAGIGSYMVFEASASYYLFVDPGKKTLIVCRLPVKMSSRARQSVDKNIHFLDLKDKKGD